MKKNIAICILLWPVCLMAGLMMPRSLLADVLGEPSIVSINLCTDQLLLLFDNAPVSIRVSPLAANNAYNYLSTKVTSGVVIKPELDTLLIKHPDAILASEYSDKYLVQALTGFGITVVMIPVARNFHQIKQNILTVAEITQSLQQGRLIIQDLNARLLKVKQKVKDKPKRTALFYAPSGFTHGSGTIYDEILHIAGLTNIAAELGIVDDGYLSLEDLLWQQPDYLILEDDFSNNHSLSQSILTHPAIKKAKLKTRVLSIPANLLACPAGASIIALEQIVEQL